MLLKTFKMILLSLMHTRLVLFGILQRLTEDLQSLITESGMTMQAELILLNWLLIYKSLLTQ
jgi:hypothetical protein